MLGGFVEGLARAAAKEYFKRKTLLSPKRSPAFFAEQEMKAVVSTAGSINNDDNLRDVNPAVRR